MARLRDAAGRELVAARVPAGRRRAGARRAARPRGDREGAARARARGEERISINVSVALARAPAFIAWLAQLLRARPGAGRAPHLRDLRARRGAATRPPRRTSRARSPAPAPRFAHRPLRHPPRQPGAGAAPAAGLRQARRRHSAQHGVTDSGAHFFAESLVRAARQLDIPVIAQHVEDEAMFQAIAGLGFSGYQGNLGGRPGALAGATGAMPASSKRPGAFETKLFSAPRRG